MKTCKRCKATGIDDGAVFCPNCGMSLSHGNGGSVSVNSRDKNATAIAIGITVIVVVSIALLVLRSLDGNSNGMVSLPMFLHEASRSDLEQEQKQETEQGPEVKQQSRAEQNPKRERESEIETESDEEMELYEQNTVESGFILPGSDVRYINENELYGLGKDECRIARNEIYARNGRRFKDQALQEYFNNKDWYNGKIDPDDFQEYMLNEYERYNVKLIEKYEIDHGYR